jgi:hypothetical protein
VAESQGFGDGPSREGYDPIERFAIGVIKSKGAYSVAQKMRRLALNVRSLFEYLKITENSRASALP